MRGGWVDAIYALLGSMADMGCMSIASSHLSRSFIRCTEAYESKQARLQTGNTDEEKAEEEVDSASTWPFSRPPQPFSKILTDWNARRADLKKFFENEHRRSTLEARKREMDALLEPASTNASSSRNRKKGKFVTAPTLKFPTDTVAE